MKSLLFPRWCRPLGFVLLLISAWSYNQEFSFLATPQAARPVSAKPANEAASYTEPEDFISLQYTKDPQPAAATMDFGGGFTNHNLTDEAALAGTLLSLFMIGFSRLKREDEYTIQVRLRALNLTVYLSYILAIGVTFAQYGLSYLLTMAYWIVVIPALYILILNYYLYVHPRLFASVS